MKNLASRILTNGNAEALKDSDISLSYVILVMK